MRIRFGVVTSLVATLGLGAALIAAPAATAATAPISVMCVGAAGDVAGTVDGAPQSSKDLIELAAKLTSIPSLPPFPTTVTTDAPDKVAIDSGDKTYTFTYELRVPAVLAELLRDKAGVQSLLIHGLGAGVKASGPVDVTVNATAADTQLNLSSPDSPVTVSMQVTVGTEQSGRIFFRPTPMTMGIKVDGNIGGDIARIGTLTLNCNAQGLIASTVVQVKGTPSTPAMIEGPTVAGGQTAEIPLLGRPDITEDDGNPFLPDSLRIIDGAGGATIEDGKLIQPTALEGGTYINEVELCAAPRQTPDIAGIDEVQTLTFPSRYPVQSGLELFNPHPLGMKLSFKGDETAEIPLTTFYGVAEYFGQFEMPSVSVMTQALEKLPSIGKGNVAVARSGANGYTITFKGKLGEADQPEIKLTGWRTQLDYAAYDQIFEAINKLTGGGNTGGGDTGGGGTGGGGTGGGGTGGGGTGGGGTPPSDPGATNLTLEELSNQLMAGQITLDEFGAKFGNALKNSIVKSLPIKDILRTLEQMFPQKPTVETATIGEPMTLGGSTGPLCTSFLVQTVATPTKVVKAVSARVAPPCRVSGRTIKVRVPVKRKAKAGKRNAKASARAKVRYRTVKLVYTHRAGGCPQTLVLNAGKLTISNLPVHGKRVTSPPRRVTITVTARGVSGKARKSFTVSRKTASASGTLKLPAKLAAAKRITVKISGSGVAAQTRTVLPS